MLWHKELQWCHIAVQLTKRPNLVNCINPGFILILYQPLVSNAQWDVPHVRVYCLEITPSDYHGNTRPHTAQRLTAFLMPVHTRRFFRIVKSHLNHAVKSYPNCATFPLIMVHTWRFFHTQFTFHNFIVLFFHLLEKWIIFCVIQEVRHALLHSWKLMVSWMRHLIPILLTENFG